MKHQRYLILNARQVDQRIKRMAYEIYESHLMQEHLMLAGVSDNGERLAMLLAQELR